MKAASYGIKNLQRVLPNLPAWTYEADKQNEGLANMYAQVKNQYMRYVLHVMKNIGGVNYFSRSEAEGGAYYSPVPKEKQLEALDFFNKQLFTTPQWLLDKNVLNKVVLPKGPNFVDDLQVKTINTLLDSSTLLALQAGVSQFGNDALPVEGLVQKLHGQIWKSLGGSRVKLDMYERSMQKPIWDQ
ncbi:zinc-dependent metalloprotease [Niabella hibiscisoli]|uniref:zinc-dependent metalloprotease n=1 Tax=Niabella hibiscisoli TaxID=1825928 RepID=UPI00374D1E38